MKSGTLTITKTSGLYAPSPLQRYSLLTFSLQTFHPYLQSHLQASIVSPDSRLPQNLLEKWNECFLSPHELDLCEAYKLVADAGKLVNLSDWFGAFEVQAGNRGEEGLNEAEIEKSPLKKRRVNGANTAASGQARTPQQRAEEEDTEHESDQDLQETSLARTLEVRFLSTVADLAFLGYIQPTKRKMEHVARVVF